MPEQPSQIGERVRNVRERCGLSQTELADLSGVSLSLIRKLEQGERADTSVETLRKLADAMDVPTTALLGEPPAEQPPANGTLWTPAREAMLDPSPSRAPAFASCVGGERHHLASQGCGGRHRRLDGTRSIGSAQLSPIGHTKILGVASMCAGPLTGRRRRGDIGCPGVR
jgi:transcriptional regulator with XRE-family HTH domain